MQQVSNLAKNHNSAVHRSLPSFLSNLALQGGRYQAQDADNNRNEQSSQRQSKGIALGRLLLGLPPKPVPWWAFSHEVLQDCQPLALVSVFP